MRDPDNIRQLISCGIDYIGFIFYEGSKRFVGKDFDINPICKIPAHIKKVGVFVDAPIVEVREIVKRNHLDLVQLHGNEDVQYCEELSTYVKIIKAFNIHDDFDFAACDAFKAHCSYFLFDTKTESHGGSGEKFDWNILKLYDNEKPFFLSGGISLPDIERIRQFENLNMHAVDVNSLFETAPAMKDINMVKVFVKRLNNI